MIQPAIDYHNDYKSISKTMLNLFCSDREKYRLTYVTGELEPREPSTAMEVGDIVHRVCLDGGNVADMVAAIPADCLKSNGAINPGKKAVLEAENPSLIYLKDKDLERVNAIIDAIKSSEVWPLIRGATDREKAIYWKCPISGLQCRAKPDFVFVDDAAAICYDLKITSRIAPWSFRKTAKSLRYWLQDAHYSAGIEAVTNRKATFRFAVVEDQFPFRLQWYWYIPQSREDARAARARSMADLAACYKTGDWSNNWDGALTLEPWDVDDGELVEFQDSEAVAF